MLPLSCVYVWIKEFEMCYSQIINSVYVWKEEFVTWYSQIIRCVYVRYHQVAESYVRTPKGLEMD